jgi:hypothetical protein
MIKEVIMNPTTIQTRSEVTGMQIHKTFEDALQASRDDYTIWKISFELSDGSRIRLVKEDNKWVYENVLSGNRL